MINKSITKLIKKPWGQEELLEMNKHYLCKRLLMKKGCRCSYQYHRYKKETIYCLSGQLTIIMEKKSVILNPGDFLTLEPREKHRMYAAYTDTYYLEASTSHPNDVVRLEDDYGR